MTYYEWDFGGSDPYYDGWRGYELYYEEYDPDIDYEAAREDDAYEQWLETWEPHTPSCEWCRHCCFQSLPDYPHCPEGCLEVIENGHGCEHFAPVIGGHDSLRQKLVQQQDQCASCDIRTWVDCHGFYDLFHKLTDEEEL